MNLDVSTLTFAGGLAACAGAAFLLLHWWHERTAWAAFWWGLANCGVGVGIMILALRDGLPRELSDIAAPLLLNACAAVTWIASRIFNGARVSPVVAIAGIAAWLALSGAAEMFSEKHIAAGLGIAVSASLYAAAAIEFWRGRGEHLHGRMPLIVVLALQAIALYLAAADVSTSVLLASRPALSIFGIIHFVGIVYAIGSAILVVAMLKERTESEYRAAALIDPLTGLPNRRAFMDLAQRVFERNEHDSKPLSLLAFDLDGFKGINDVHGHAMGDQVLGIFADILSRTIRPTDVAGRLGGEEFVAVLLGCDAKAAQVIAGRIRAAFQESALSVDGQRIGATVSIGVATAAGEDCTPARALEKADAALYRAKELGRNQVVLAEEACTPAGANIVRIA